MGGQEEMEKPVLEAVLTGWWKLTHDDSGILTQANIVCENYCNPEFEAISKLFTLKEISIFVLHLSQFSNKSSIIKILYYF